MTSKFWQKKTGKPTDKLIAAFHADINNALRKKFGATLNSFSFVAIKVVKPLLEGAGRKLHRLHRGEHMADNCWVVLVDERVPENRYPELPQEYHGLRVFYVLQDSAKFLFSRLFSE